jgi:hypothetical protein
VCVCVYYLSIGYERPSINPTKRTISLPPSPSLSVRTISLHTLFIIIIIIIIILVFIIIIIITHHNPSAPIHISVHRITPPPPLGTNSQTSVP